MKHESIETRKARRKREAVQGVLLFALLQLLTAVCMGALCFIPDVPGWFVVLFGVLAAMCMLAVIPALLALRERFKEIEGGELDEASKY